MRSHRESKFYIRPCIDLLTYTPLQSGVKYVIILSDILVNGSSSDTNRFGNVHVILHNMTFEQTSGVVFQNVTLLVEGNLRYMRNSFALVIFTTFDDKPWAVRTLRLG